MLQDSDRGPIPELGIGVERSPRWVLFRRWHVLVLLFASVLGVRHMALHFGYSEFAHIAEIVDSLALMDQGQWLFPSSDLWETDIRGGGPLFYWLHYPARFISKNPVLALAVYYALLEGLAIGAFLVGALRWRVFPEEITWAAALLLCFYSGHKLVLAENMTLAVDLTIPALPALIMALAVAERRPDRGRHLLPLVFVGVLLGLAQQIHLTVIFLVPGLVAAVGLTPGPRLRRLLALLAGWGLVLVAFAPALEPPPPAGDGVAELWWMLLEQFSAADLAVSLITLLFDPLSILGLSLAAAAWTRGRGTDPSGLATRTALAIAAAWLVLPGLLLTVACSYLQTMGWDSRHGMIYPARAVLGATALFWLVRFGNTHLLSRVTERRLRPMDAVTGVAVVLLAVSVLHLHVNRVRFAGEVTEGTESCDCDFWIYRDESRHMQRNWALVSAAEIPVQEDDRLKVHSIAREEMEAMFYWWRTAGPSPGPTWRSDGPVTHLVQAPARIGEFAMGELEEAIDLGSFVLVPGCLPAQVQNLGSSEGTERLRVTLDPAQVQRTGPLMAILRWTSDHPTRGERLVVSGSRVNPTARCDCAEGPGGWSGTYLVFDSGALWAGDEFVLEVDGLPEELALVDVFLLPDLNASHGP
jgi:hypothetical protein